MTGGRQFAIVGGGIAGLATALALAKIAEHCIVLEQADAFREIGAGIQLGPNGLRVLDQLGLLPDIEPVAVRPTSLIVMDAVAAEQVTRIPTGPEFVERFGYPYTLVHRADLHRALLQACARQPQITLRPGAVVTGFQETSDGVQVNIAGQNSLQAAALVGADGLWSATRQVIIGDGAPRVSGHIAYRAVLPIAAIEERYRHNAMMLWAGPRNHLVQYPLRGGELFNLVAVFHSDRYVEGWDREGDPEELSARFAGNCATVRELLRKVETWRMWVLCDRDPVRSWNRGRVVLVGDAAHPMLQYLAQGAGMSLEDAVTLAACVQHGAANLETSFEKFTDLRYRRTARCQVMARIYGGFYHAEGVTRELRNEFLAERDAQSSYESLAWLYDHKAA